MKTYPKLHLLFGVLGIVLFLLSGLYMEMVHSHLEGMEEGRRMLYRSAHIYILLTAIINLIVSASYMQLPYRWLNSIASLIILASPVLMTLEFFYGTSSLDERRIFALLCVVSLSIISIILVGDKLMKKSLTYRETT